MTATDTGCVHPSAMPAPVHCERHDYQSHVHDGVVLRLCMSCGEPDWAAFHLEVDRLVKARLAAIAAAVLGGLHGLRVVPGITPDELATALEGFWLDIATPAGTTERGQVADADRVADAVHATLSHDAALRQDPR